MNSFLVSAGLFTTVPLPPTLEITRDRARRAIFWFPVVGALVGLAGGAVSATVFAISGNSLLAAAVGVAVMQLLIGAMHLDGLADTADGLAALGSMKDGRDAARALEIMRQPDTGAMGVVTLALTLLCQVAALSSASTWWAFIVGFPLCSAAGRIAVVIATRPGVPPAHEGGFGALFAGCTRPATVAFWLVVLTGCAAACLSAVSPWSALAAACAVLAAQAVALVWSKTLVRRFGGLSGDMYGAVNELTVTTSAIALALCL